VQRPAHARQETGLHQANGNPELESVFPGQYESIVRHIGRQNAHARSACAAIVSDGFVPRFAPTAAPSTTPTPEPLSSSQN